jgi:hypothetical protein
MVLRPGEIDAVRRALDQRKAARATIHRLSQVRDSTGGWVDTYTPVHTYDCTFSPFPITPLERETATNVRVISAWQFLFPSGVDIISTDRLVVGTRTWEVVQAGTRSTDLQTRVVAQEVTV